MQSAWIFTKRQGHFAPAAKSVIHSDHRAFTAILNIHSCSNDAMDVSRQLPNLPCEGHFHAIVVTDLSWPQIGLDFLAADLFAWEFVIIRECNCQYGSKCSRFWYLKHVCRFLVFHITQTMQGTCWGKPFKHTRASVQYQQIARSLMSDKYSVNKSNHQSPSKTFKYIN